MVIHPFIDGNGRTTRLATKVLLANMGLDAFNLFSFENYYNNNVTKYFDHVGEQGDYYDLASNMDFTAWLEYFSDGIIDELIRVKAILFDKDIFTHPTLGSHLLKLLRYIRRHRSIADKQYAKLVERAKATRALDFQKLIDLRLIERVGKGPATYYILKISQ